MPDNAVQDNAAPDDALGPLVTDRLLLRRSVVEDAAVFHQLWTERDPRVPPHRRLDAAGRPTVEDIDADLRTRDEGSKLRLLTVELRVTGEAVGYCGLNPGHGDLADEPELAYELLRRVQGNGYATEAAEAVLAWAGRAGYRRVRAGVWSWNLASRRVLAKLGFREEGVGEPTSVHGRTVLTVRDL